MTSTATRAGSGAPQASGPEPGQDGPPQRSRSGLAGLLDLPGNAVRRVVHHARGTPGRLSVIAVGLVLLAVVVAVVGTVMLQDRKNTIDGLVDHREPLAAAAQEVYRSLSDADATAASSFLYTGNEPLALSQRYDRDIAKAGVALAKAASDSAGVPEAAAQVGVLSRNLPVYTALVEKARANNRQGFPVGAAYQREASELMRSTLLPAAQDLYRIDTDRLIEEQDDAAGVPWLITALALGLLAALVVTQVYLKRRTNRVFNVGLLVATGAVVVTILWGAVAVTVQSLLVHSGSRNGTEQVDVLVRARIAALQARADETLTLVARGGGDTYVQEFATLTTQLAGKDGTGGLLLEAQGLASEESSAEDVGAAADSARAWLAAHRKVRELAESGAYTEAVDLTINVNDPASAAATFAQLDENLNSAIAVGRQAFLDDTANGSAALTLLAPGVAVLAVVAAGGATVGIRERLREYR